MSIKTTLALRSHSWSSRRYRCLPVRRPAGPARFNTIAPAPPSVLTAIDHARARPTPHRRMAGPTPAITSFGSKSGP